MNYYIANTKEEAETCLSECHEAEMLYRKTDKGTKRWYQLMQRLTDGKYIIPVCNHYSNPRSLPVEVGLPEWFEQEETP